MGSEISIVANAPTETYLPKLYEEDDCEEQQEPIRWEKENPYLKKGEVCEHCKDYEICGFCKKKSAEKWWDSCASNFFNDACRDFEPIEFCPKCGRRLKKES